MMSSPGRLHSYAFGKREPLRTTTSHSFCHLTGEDDGISPKTGPNWGYGYALGTGTTKPRAIKAENNKATSSTIVIDLTSDDEDVPGKNVGFTPSLPILKTRELVPREGKHSYLDVPAKKAVAKAADHPSLGPRATDAPSDTVFRLASTRNSPAFPHGAAPMANVTPNSASLAQSSVSATLIASRADPQESNSYDEIFSLQRLEVGQGDDSHDSAKSGPEEFIQKRVDAEIERQVEEEMAAARAYEEKVAAQQDDTPVTAASTSSPHTPLEKIARIKKVKRGFAALTDEYEESQSSDHTMTEGEAECRKRYLCPICNIGFTIRGDVGPHFKRCVAKNGNPDAKSWDSHPSCQVNSTPRGPCVCPRCGLLYKHPVDLRHHFKTCAEKNGHPEGKTWDEGLKNRPHQCPICDTGFARKDALKRHHDVCAQKSSQAECNVRDGDGGSRQQRRKSAGESRSEKERFSEHSTNRQTLIHRCPICDRHCNSHSHVRDHFSRCVRRNGNPRELQWDSCLDLRPELYKGDEVTNCPFCDRTFTRRDNLTKHLKNIHRTAEMIALSKCQEQNTKPAFSRPKTSKSLATTRSDASRKSQRSHTDTQLTSLDVSVLRPKRKQTLNEIPIDTLFDPRQVVSKKQLERTAEAKRRKFEQQWERKQGKVIYEEPCEMQEKLPASGAEAHQEMTDMVLHFPDVPHGCSSSHTLGVNDTETPATSLTATTADSPAPEPAAKVLKRDVEEVQPKEPLRERDLHVTPQPPANKQTSPGTSRVSPQNRRESVAELPHREDIASSEHPTTGGKSISAATLAAWEAQSNDVDDSETPITLYVYFVQIRNWQGSEHNASTKKMGPYYTVAEANAVASTEVKYPLESLEENMPDARIGWSYTFEEDQHGMQTHELVAGGFHAKTIVHRETPIRQKRHALPSSAFRAPQFIYIVQTLRRYASLPETDLFGERKHTSSPTPPDCEHSVLSSYTVHNLANEHAADHYRSLATAGLTRVQQKEFETDMRRELAELGEGGYFRKTVEFEEEAAEAGGVGRKGDFDIWVEKVEVGGPRN